MGAALKRHPLFDFTELPLTLRPLEVADSVALKRLSDLVFPLTYPQGFFEECINEENTIGLGIFDANGLLAFVFVMINYNTPQLNLKYTAEDMEMAEMFGNRVAYISTIAVRPDGQRHGLGSFMLSQVARIIGKCSEPDQAIYLHCMTNNYPAIGFYQKLGFKKVKAVRGYYRNCCSHPDAYIMVKSLVKRKVLVEKVQDDKH